MDFSLLMQALMAILLSCLVLVIVLSALIPVWRWRYSHMPGYQGWPLLGNLLDIQRLTWHGFHEQGFKEHGPVFRMFYGSEIHIVVASASAVKYVLRSCPKVFEFPVPFGHVDRRMLLDGLAFARDLDYHAKIRSAWLPAFSSASLSSFQDCIESKASDLVLRLEQHQGKEMSVEIWKMLCSASFSIMASTGFGQVSEARVLSAFHTILEASVPDKTGIWLPIFLMFHPSFRGPIRTLANLFPDLTMKKLIGAQKELREIAFELIEAERANDVTGQRQTGTRSFLNQLLDLKDLTDAEIAANVYTWLAAGAETPANAMSYTIYQLALNPECEAKVQKEVDSNPNGPYPYLNATIQEAMRLMSPASKILREATEDVVLPNGMHLPKGTRFQVSLRMAMLDPEAWYEPCRFNPERFLNRGDSVDDLSNMVAFGGGSRLCIGMKLAEKMMRIILSKIYKKFRVELEPGQVPLRLQTGLTMTPVDGIKVRIIRR